MDMDYYSYEISFNDSIDKIIIDSVSDVKVENGVYLILRDNLVLFTAPTESIFYIKSM